MTAESTNRNRFLQAAHAGDLPALEKFLDSGIDINYKPPWPNDDDEENGAPAIVQASMYGHLSAVKMLIDRGADIDNKNEFPLCPLTALLIASIDGYVEIVKLLVARGAKAEAEVFQGTTTPLVACAGNSLSSFTERHMGIVNLLLDNGHNIEALDENGGRPLILAARNGNTELLKLLLDRGANVNARTSSDESGTSALDEVATDGRLELVRLLLDRGAEIKHKKKGFTALHKAAMNGRLEVMKLLLQKGAIAEALETHCTTALHKAAMVGATDSVKFLLSHGFLIEATSLNKGNTPLLEAADSGSTSTVEVLLGSGANVNARNNDADTALHLATKLLNLQDESTWGTSHYPRLDLIKLLLSRGGDVTIVDHNGKSVLQKAVQPLDPPVRSSERETHTVPRGDIDAVKLLLSFGADVSVRDVEGETVLHRAAHEHNAEMIQILLDAGAEVDAKKVDGTTPLFEPVGLGPRNRLLWWTAAPAMEVLLDAGADINSRKEGGRTVLHELVVTVRNLDKADTVNVIALLLARGVDIEARDSNGETALQVAERLGKVAVVELLEEDSHARQST